MDNKIPFSMKKFNQFPNTTYSLCTNHPDGPKMCAIGKALYAAGLMTSCEYAPMTGSLCNIVDTKSWDSGVGGVADVNNSGNFSLANFMMLEAVRSSGKCEIIEDCQEQKDEE